MSRPSSLRQLASCASSSSRLCRREYATVPHPMRPRNDEPVRSYAGSSTSPYPFSSSAKTCAPTVAPLTPLPRQLVHPKNGWHLVTHLRSAYQAEHDPKDLLSTWFSRRHHDRLRPGAVLSVASYTTLARTTTSSFAGVLIGIRRAGPDTSFKLRNIVARVGVEMSFKVCSPWIKEIKILKPAPRGGEAVRFSSEKLGRAEKPLRRAKANFLRDKPNLLASIAGTVKRK